VKHGYAFKGQYFADSGPYVVLTPGNFYDEGGFKEKGEKEKYYTGDVPNGFLLRRGDLLVAMTEQAEGLLGSSAIVPADEKYLHNQRLGLIEVLDKKELDKKFAYYLFNHKNVRSQIRASASGVKVRHTSPERICQVKALIPPLLAQRKIAAILSAYDDLTENNRRRIRILEGMAQAIYREWFVHFRFPGHEKVKMVTSPLGPIPQGWEVKRLGDLCHIVMGQSPKSEFYNEAGEGLPFHQGVTDFGIHFPTNRVYCTVQNRTAEAGDILFSVRAPVGRINVAVTRMVIGRGLCAIRSRDDTQMFTLYELKEKFREEDTMGGGTIFKSVTKDDVDKIEFLQPLDKLIREFEELATPLFAHIGNLTKKNDNLCQTRDLLLPELISGEPDVGELDINVREDLP
jgi:type I restriction enzyme S subunit